MAFNFSRIKQWLGFDNLTNSDLNAEFNNLIAKAGADTLSGANSTNGSAPTVAAMQTTESPGAVGSEVLSKTVQEDIQQIRYQIDAITGQPQWYSAPPTTLATLLTLVSGIYTSPTSRIVSGRKSTLNQPMFLVPNGGSPIVTLNCSSTNLSVYFNGTPVTLSSNLTISGLSTAPSSNNTATINDGTLSAQQSSLIQGERGTLIQINSAGSAITALAGTYAAFKVGSGTPDYFIGEIYSNATTLSCTFTKSALACTFTNATPTVATSATHGLTTYDPIVLSGGSLPTGVSAGTYYVTVVDSNTFKISTTIANAYGGTFVASSSTGSGTAVSALTAPMVVTATAHGLNIGDQVIFSGGSLPTGVSAGTIYYVTNVIDTNDFAISASLGGSTVVTTSTGSGTGTPSKYLAIRNCFRGVGFSSIDAWYPRHTVSNGDTITLLKLSYIFATYISSTPGLSVTYNQPTVSNSTPSFPSIGDFWFDIVNDTWKVYSGSAFVTTPSVFVGICIQDNANCIVARSADFANVFNELNDVEIEYLDSADVRANRRGTKVSVYGKTFSFQNNQPIWNTTSSLDTGVSLVSSTTYYCYVSDQAALVLSNVAPTERKWDLLGGYHPQKPWRCVGEFTTDGSQNVIASSCTVQNHHQRVLPTNFGVNGTFSANALSVGGISLAAGVGGNPVFSQRLTRYSSPAVNSSLTATIAQTSNGNASFLDLGASVSITTSGNPVELRLVSDGSGSNSNIELITGGTSLNDVIFRIMRNDTTEIARLQFAITTSSASAPSNLYLPCSVISHVDFPAAGTYNYKIQFINHGSATFALNASKLLALEY